MPMEVGYTMTSSLTVACASFDPRDFLKHHGFDRPEASGCLPDQVCVNTKIVVAGKIAKRGHFTPWQMRMPRLDFIGEFLASFPDHGQSIGQGIVGFVIRDKFVECAIRD
jgi:hypothetical protein